jgi:hypothetical protein
MQAQPATCHPVQIPGLGGRLPPDISGGSQTCGPLDDLHIAGSHAVLTDNVHVVRDVTCGWFLLEC